MLIIIPWYIIKSQIAKVTKTIKVFLPIDSTGVFNGKILVEKEAQKTNAFQANNNILISDKASINTKPQLEIFADDVNAHTVVLLVS